MKPSPNCLEFESDAVFEAEGKVFLDDHVFFFFCLIGEESLRKGSIEIREC